MERWSVETIRFDALLQYSDNSIRRIRWLVLSAVLFTFCFSADAQQQANLPRIGWLGSRTADSPGSGRELFRRELRKLGYAEGTNIAFELRSAATDLDRLPAIADELVQLKVAVLVTSSGTAAVVAKNATKTIPIVFLGVSDPVGLGLVDSLAHPGGNLTGTSDIQAALIGKRLELLKETVPKLSRVGFLWTPQIRGSSPVSSKESRLAARQMGLELHSMEVINPDKYDIAFKEAIKAGVTAVIVVHNSLASSNRIKIATVAAKNRLPAIYPREDYVVTGGMMSYGPDEIEPYKRVAVMVDKILKGAKPADLPVEQPTKFELVINLKAAKQIGLTIPPNVLARADKVIK